MKDPKKESIEPEIKRIENTKTKDIRGTDGAAPAIVPSEKSHDLPIIAVDFDGTLVFNRYPFIENPNYKLINYIKQHWNEHIWILWTCRHGEQLDRAIEYMKHEHGIVFDYVNENVPWLIEEYGDCRKVSADVYIDDRNCSFDFCTQKV